MRQALVTIRTPSGETYDFRMGRSSFTVGRRADCELALPAAEVSSLHARFEVDAEAGRIFLTDLGSKNGTFLGERRLDANVREQIVPESEVHIANVALRVRFFDPLQDDSASLSLDSSNSLSRSLLRGLLGEAVKRARARLEVTSGPAQGAIYVIDEVAEETSVGSGAHLDFDLQDPALSGLGAVIRRRGHHYDVVPEPAAEARLGRQRLHGPVYLRDGVELRLGQTRIAFADPLQAAIDELANLDAESPETRPVGRAALRTAAGPAHPQAQPDARFVKTVRQPVVEKRRFSRGERVTFIFALLSLLAAVGFLLVVLGVIDLG